MNKITYLVTTLLIISSSLFAQGEVDALRFSREGLYGTARAMSMGGAFGALGGDQSALAINPAGIGVYRSSEVVGTFNLSNNQSVVGDQTANKTRFNMDNLGFVGYFPLRNDMMPVINFGFSYNKLQSFDRNISAIGTAKGTLIDYIAKNSAGIDPLYLEMGDNLPDPFLDMPWLTVLGYNSWLIDPVDDEGTQYEPVTTEAGPINEIRLRERGYIDNYDFTVGTTIGNVINLGFALSIKDISYSLTSDYLEDFNNGGYTLTNWLNTTGAGVSAKIGAIYRPVNELRLGLAYHTPTWYALTETYEAQIDDDMGAYISDPNYQPAVTSSKSFINDYDLKTPGKLVASIATVLGGRFIASLDYEMTDYSNEARAPLRANEEGIGMNGTMSISRWISGLLRPSVQEWNIVSHSSSRVVSAMPGCRTPTTVTWLSSVMQPSLDRTPSTRIEGDTNYLTGGFGYRFNRNFFLDMAVVYSSQTDDLYPFPNYYDGATLSVDASPCKMDNNSLKGLVTLGYKF